MSDKRHATIGTFGHKSEDFHLKEYEFLRRELEIILQEDRALERNVVVAVGVTWGWLYSQHTPPWTYCIPFLFAVLGAWRAYGINETYGTFGTYLEKIEEAFTKEGSPKGWQHFLDEDDEGTSYSKGALTFWVILIISTIVVGAFIYFHQRVPSPLPRLS
jgi:hypothetical protein